MTPISPLPAPPDVAPVRPGAGEALGSGTPDALLQTRFSRMIGLRYPLVQGGMSWASSSAALAAAVSNAGALGVVAAGPMYPDALRKAIHDVREATDRPFAVNVPLYNKNAAAHLDIVASERVPIIIGSQGSPRGHVARFRDAGALWLHVVASPVHAAKAEEAGVDAVVAVGGEAGGHPPASQVSTLVLVRAVVRAVSVPVVGAGGVADGAGVAALLALGADAVQLGTRFLMTQEASVHPAYKEAVRAAGVEDTMLVGPAHLPIRMLRNAFAVDFEARRRAGASEADLDAHFKAHSLKAAALEGNVAWGKTEAGQCAGLIGDVPSAAEVVSTLVREMLAARDRLAGGAMRAVAPTGGEARSST